MKSLTKNVVNQKKGTEENVGERLLGIVRGVHVKANSTSASLDFTPYEASKAVRVMEIKAEQEKAEAVKFMLGNQLTRL